MQRSKQEPPLPVVGVSMQSSILLTSSSGTCSLAHFALCCGDVVSARINAYCCFVQELDLSRVSHSQDKEREMTEL